MGRGGGRRTTMEEPCAISAATSGAESLHRSNGVQFFFCSCAVCDIGFLFATPGLFDQNGLPTALQSALKRSSSSGRFQTQVVDSSVGLRLRYLHLRCCLMVVPNSGVRPIIRCSTHTRRETIHSDCQESAGLVPALGSDQQLALTLSEPLAD